MNGIGVRVDGTASIGKRLESTACTTAMSWTRELFTRARDRMSGRLPRDDAGMTTSEYAMGTIAACAFAAALYQVITSDTVSTALESIIGKALNAPF